MNFGSQTAHAPCEDFTQARIAVVPPLFGPIIGTTLPGEAAKKGCRKSESIAINCLKLKSQVLFKYSGTVHKYFRSYSLSRKGAPNISFLHYEFLKTPVAG